VDTVRRGRITGALLCAALLAGCGGGTAEPGPAPVVSADAALVEDFAGVALPPSTRDLRVAHLSGGPDELLVASFTLDRADLDPFWRSGDFDGPAQPGERVLTDDLGLGLGWDLDQAGAVLGHEEDVDGLVRQVVVDVDDPRTPVVHLRAFET
jgi:hypothetical protein